MFGLLMAGKVTCIPGRGAVVGLCGVVVAFTVATEVKQLVLDVPAAETIEVEDLVGESLPLGLGALGVVAAVGLVWAVDQTEVGGGLEIVRWSAEWIWAEGRFGVHS